MHMHVLHVSRYPERPEEDIRSARAGWIMEAVSYPMDAGNQSPALWKCKSPLHHWASPFLQSHC